MLCINSSFTTLLFVLRVCDSCVSCLVSFVTFFSVFCWFCYWLSGCWPGTLINKNWVELNSINWTIIKKLQWIQKMFVALCYNIFLSPDSHGCNYANALQLDRESLNLVHFSWILLVFEVPLGTSELYIFMLVSQSVQTSSLRRVCHRASSGCSDLEVFRRQIITLMFYIGISLLL
jgi:hypothetical protein